MWEGGPVCMDRDVGREGVLLKSETHDLGANAISALNSFGCLRKKLNI